MLSGKTRFFRTEDLNYRNKALANLVRIGYVGRIPSAPVPVPVQTEVQGR